LHCGNNSIIRDFKLNINTKGPGSLGGREVIVVPFAILVVMLAIIVYPAVIGCSRNKDVKTVASGENVGEMEEITRDKESKDTS